MGSVRILKRFRHGEALAIQCVSRRTTHRSGDHVCLHSAESSILCNKFSSLTTGLLERIYSDTDARSDRNMRYPEIIAQSGRVSE